MTTHAELVAAVEEAQGEDLGPSYYSQEAAYGYNSAANAHLDTLAAILNLHRPVLEDEWPAASEGMCRICPDDWPCPTVGIVVDALRKMTDPYRGKS